MVHQGKMMIDPKQMTLADGTELTPSEEAATSESGILDRSWVKIAFMVPLDEIGDTDDRKNTFYTSASAKYTDTRLGCNIGINPKPQWTRYADIRVKGRMVGRNDVNLTSVSGNYGMGSAYSEGLDAAAQKIFLRFGVPKFNSLLNFLQNAFDREQMILARTGRAPSAFYTLAKVAGVALTAISFPALTIGVMVGKAIMYAMARPTNKFFTLKPTMFSYWSTVNHLVINHAVNVGLIKKILNTEEGQRLGRPYKFDDTQISIMTDMFPDMFRDGTFDILAMATKAQRLANKQFRTDYDRLSKDSATDFEGYLKRDFSTGSHETMISDEKGNPTLGALFNHLSDFSRYWVAERNDSVIQEMDPRYKSDGEPPPPGEISPLGEHVKSMVEYIDAETRQGAEFAVFRVNHTGSVSESFGNSVAESDLAQKFNGMSSQFKEARFSIADGTLFSGVLGSVQNALADVATGAIDGVTLGFSGLVAGLGGSGYIDIPKHWQSSSATLPRGSYKMQLISPYNNPVSQMMNLWIPFYMLVAGGLPRATGKASYTSPFYCQLYDRGRLQSKLAMIESISVTRGTSNLQFDTLGKVLALDLSFDIVDLSTIMHMPVGSGKILDVDITIDDDNILMDYLNVLGGMDIYSQIYEWPKAQLAMTKKLASLKYKATSPAFHAVMFKNSLQDGFINDITQGTSGLFFDVIEGVNRGSASIDGTRD